MVSYTMSLELYLLLQLLAVNCIENIQTPNPAEGFESCQLLIYFLSTISHTFLMHLCRKFMKERPLRLQGTFSSSNVKPNCERDFKGETGGTFLPLLTLIRLMYHGAYAVLKRCTTSDLQNG